MNSPSIQVQVVEDGISIPVKYLSNAYDFEFERINGNVIVRPKRENGGFENEETDVHILPLDDTEDEPEKSWIFDWAGSGHSKNPYASVQVEEILAEGMNRRSGWTLKPPLEEGNS